jgi:hypothetical protein
MSVAWWCVPAGVVALAACELVALALGRRSSHPSGVPTAARLMRIGAVVALGGAASAVLALLVTLPIGDAVGLAAAGAAGIALVAVVLLRLARSAATG